MKCWKVYEEQRDFPDICLDNKAAKKGGDLEVCRYQGTWVGFKMLAGSPFQLGHLNATILFSLSVAVTPFCIPELGRSDNDFRQGETRRCLQSLHMNMYASVKSKD